MYAGRRGLHHHPVGERPRGPAEHGGSNSGEPDLDRSRNRQAARDPAREAGDVLPASRAAPLRGRRAAGRGDFRLDLRPGGGFLPNRRRAARRPEGSILPAPSLLLPAEDRISGRGGVVERSDRGDGGGHRCSRGNHQGDVPDRVASGGVPDRRDTFRGPAPRDRPEPGALGLYGEPDPLQARGSGLDSARPEHDPPRHSSRTSGSASSTSATAAPPLPSAG